MKRILFFSLLIAMAVIAFFYFATYESGVMAGKVLRITEKGMIFKTYEGKLSIDSFGALKGVSPVAETFDFSIEASETGLLKELEEVALTGERVNLKFEKKYMIIPWKGDTKYLVIGVERLK